MAQRFVIRRKHHLPYLQQRPSRPKRSIHYSACVTIQCTIIQQTGAEMLSAWPPAKPIEGSRVHLWCIALKGARPCGAIGGVEAHFQFGAGSFELLEDPLPRIC